MQSNWQDYCSLFALLVYKILLIKKKKVKFWSFSFFVFDLPPKILYENNYKRYQ